ncbi:MAG: hypothetical protein KJ622_13650 [Alphaproteobacteria bacterium]|nr:hypothetical protein [Alphaproteobacteria bacterium]
MNVGECEEVSPRADSAYTAVWFLKRLVIGTAILVFSFGCLAWLTHAAIDPSLVEGETLLDTLGRLASHF